MVNESPSDARHRACCRRCALREQLTYRLLDGSVRHGSAQPAEGQRRARVQDQLPAGDPVSLWLGELGRHHSDLAWGKIFLVYAEKQPQHITQIAGIVDLRDIGRPPRGRGCLLAERSGSAAAHGGLGLRQCLNCVRRAADERTVASIRTDVLPARFPSLKSEQRIQHDTSGQDVRLSHSANDAADLLGQQIGEVSPDNLIIEPS